MYLLVVQLLLRSINNLFTQPVRKKHIIATVDLQRVCVCVASFFTWERHLRPREVRTKTIRFCFFVVVAVSPVLSDISGAAIGHRPPMMLMCGTRQKDFACRHPCQTVARHRDYGAFCCMSGFQDHLGTSRQLSRLVHLFAAVWFLGAIPR